MVRLGAIILLVLLPLAVFAHSGGRDTYGCHNNTALAIYECHEGSFAGRSWPNPGGKDAMLAELGTSPPMSEIQALKDQLFLLEGRMARLEHRFAGIAFLSWQASPSQDVIGYKVYSGTQPGIYGQSIILGLTQAYPMLALEAATTHYFVVTAYTADGRESGYSNEVSKAVP